MALTAGQTRWLDAAVGEERTQVIDGRVSGTTVDGDTQTVSVVGAAGAVATFELPAEVEVTIGEDAAVRVEGTVQSWEPDGDDGARLIVTGDAGRFVESVTPPRTDAEERDHQARLERDRAAAAEAQRIADEERAAADAHAAAERQAQVTALRDRARTGSMADLQAIVAHLTEVVYGGAPADPPAPPAPR